MQRALSGSDRGPTLASFRLRSPDLRQPSFRKLGSANQGNQESRLRITARRSLHAGLKFRMECVGKTCCAATYRVRCLPEIRFLKFVSELSYTGAGEGI